MHYYNYLKKNYMYIYKYKVNNIFSNVYCEYTKELIKDLIEYQLKFHTFSSSRFDIDRQYKWSKPIQ